MDFLIHTTVISTIPWLIKYLVYDTVHSSKYTARQELTRLWGHTLKTTIKRDPQNVNTQQQTRCKQWELLSTYGSTAMAAAPGGMPLFFPARLWQS